MPGLHRDADVLEDAEGLEDTDDLEGARDAAGHHLMRRQSGDDVAVEARLAAVSREEAGQHVEERRLARAVRADDRAQLTATHLEGGAAHRGETAEVLAHAVHVEEPLSVHGGAGFE
jgi:hypothetical protein